MDGNRIARRATVVGEDGSAVFVGRPWSIVGGGDFDRNGNADILWHNESTNETQIWFMDGNRIARRATVVDAHGAVNVMWVVGGDNWNGPVAIS